MTIINGVLQSVSLDDIDVSGNLGTLSLPDLKSWSCTVSGPWEPTEEEAAEFERLLNLPNAVLSVTDKEGSTRRFSARSYREGNKDVYDIIDEIE